MSQLTSQTTVNADLSAGAQILNYSYMGTTPRELSARILFGDGTKNLSGTGGNYLINVLLNGIVISPTSVVVVATNLLQTIGTSRPFLVDAGDLITIVATGMIGDTAVTCTTELRDSTPLTQSDILGPGFVRVDQNYGGTNALQVVSPGNIGLAGATLLAYLEADWSANHRSQQYVQARTTTVDGGNWANPFYLMPSTYVIAAHRQPDYAESTVTLVVT